MDMLSKEVSPVAKAAGRTKPTLMIVGDKQMISTGRWNDQLMADYVSEQSRADRKDPWIKIGELAIPASTRSELAQVVSQGVKDLDTVIA